MDTRERIRKTFNHDQPNKLVVDFGSTLVTGMQVSVVYQLRQYYGLDKPGTPVKVIEPYQMLGEIKDDLKEIIGVDFIGLMGKKNFWGFNNDNWKEWKLFDGTPVLVADGFNTKLQEDGYIYQYAEADKSYPPCARMPKDGFYFDAIIRQKPIKEKKLDPEDNMEEFGLLSDKDLDYFKKEAERLYKDTKYGIVGSVANSGFGDIALVVGPTLKDPKGIRDVTEWYMSLNTRRDYIKKVFDRQCEIAIENYKKIYKTLGDKIAVVFISGTDFGMQNGIFISKENFRDLFKPFYKRVNTWIHENTTWKCFNHSCGSVYDLIPDFIDAGFDILNPVQISAAKMDPVVLKKEFGKDTIFWGGGVDTQKLPFKTPDEVKEEVKKLIDIFNKDGGFVFNAVHNVQSNIPVENIAAMINVINEFRR